MNSVQRRHAESLRSLHRPGDPLVLFNVWDVGSAIALQVAGAQVIATSSYAVAAARGFPDGEQLPFMALVHLTERLAACVPLPITIDFEGGYATDLVTLRKNTEQLVEAGAVGVNLEDQRVGVGGLYSAGQQAERIRAIRAAAATIFLNARTDLFFNGQETRRHADLIDEAVHRAALYQKAGADCFFVPGLVDIGLIGSLCEQVSMPVNVMVSTETNSFDDLRAAGVARISFGPSIYQTSLAAVSTAFTKYGASKRSEAQPAPDRVS